MEPGGSELDSSPPQPENPCLIVEDSQPDSVALEDDPESSYRALLARRLSSLQPTSRSPVLELISSPLGSRYSQSDSQSESSQSNNQAEPGILMAANPSAALEEESQVVDINPPPNKKKCAAEEAAVEPGADSTTHCMPSEGGASQFGFLELSESQDVRGEVLEEEEEEEEEDDVPRPDGERRAELAEQKVSSRTPEGRDHNAARSEVSSSSSLESSGRSGRKMGIQALLHSEGLEASDEQGRDILSSQEDMFAADKSGAAVDSTVSEPEQQDAPTPTPAHTLGLLHLSGQGALVQESLSQSSIDYVGPTPDNFTQTPLIVPSSPTGPEHQRDGDEAMDTSLPPGDAEKVEEEEPMDTESASKPRPSASTPVSQNPPGFVLDRTLSLPSQPEFSHDAFVPTQSQETPTAPDRPSPSQRPEPAPPLRLSADSPPQHEEDSQATQIEEPDESPARDSAAPHCGSDSNGVPPHTWTPAGEAESPQQRPLNVATVNVEASSARPASSSDLTADSSVQETPPADATPRRVPSPCASQTAAGDGEKGPVPSQREGGGGARSPSVGASTQECGAAGNSQTDERRRGEAEEEEEEGEEEEEVMMMEESPGMAFVLSQSQLLSPEPMEEAECGGRGEDSVVVVTDSERDSQALQKDAAPPSLTSSSLPVSTNGHQPQAHGGKAHAAPDRLSQTPGAGPDPEGLSDSSGDISFHFTLPKEGELIGPVVGATPPLISQLKQTLRHSTPIEITSFSEKSGSGGNGSMAASNMASGASGDEAVEKGDGKLSLRMKLVTPVEEGSSERFSLQKPTLSDEEEPVAMVTTVANAVASPSVFTRVRQVHRQQEAREDLQAGGHSTPVRGQLFAPPQRSSPASSLGCNSLSNSQSEPPQEEASPRETLKAPPTTEPTEHTQAPPPEPPTPNEADARLRAAQQSAAASSPSKLRQRTVSQQTSFDAPGQRSPAGRGEPESPSFRRAAGPAHRRHVRTIQEVRTTVTRVITDVYYDDGKEVERKVTEENEEPVVDCQVLDSDISPCRTGSSMTSGDLGDISSLSSKASSLQHSSGGTSGGFTRPDLIMPPSRGAFRGGAAGSLLRQPLSSSEDEPLARMLPPRLPLSPAESEPHGRSDSLRSSPEEAGPGGSGPGGSSLVGLRVVAKWSSNGYFYSGRIVRDTGEGRFRLRFDDGYECEVAGRDILLCDPIPLETEVTALLEDEYFSIGVVRGHKTEGQDLFYSVEKDAQRQWYNRTAIILSLEQGNKLREQHSLGPYEPSTPLAKASDISLDNLVEGKRRRRGAPEGQNTPNRGSSGSPRTPGPSGKRKLLSSEESRSPAKRGRRGSGGRAGTKTTPEP